MDSALLPDQPAWWRAGRLPDITSRRWVLAAASVVACAVAVIDWVSPPSLSPAALYLVPVLFVAVTSSTRTASIFVGCVFLAGLFIALVGVDDANQTYAVVSAILRLVLYVPILWLIAGQRSLVRSLHEQATTDPMTGALNRTAFYEAAEREVARARRQGDAVAIIYFDIDGLKDLNDSEGHEAGDELIESVVTAAQGHLRETDLLSRLGGDEFVVLALVDDVDDARRLAVRMRDSIGHPSLARPARASFGVWVSRAPGDDMDALVNAADELMYSYSAKQSGGGAVLVGGPAVGPFDRPLGGPVQDDQDSGEVPAVAPGQGPHAPTSASDPTVPG